MCKPVAQDPIGLHIVDRILEAATCYPIKKEPNLKGKFCLRSFMDKFSIGWSLISRSLLALSLFVVVPTVPKSYLSNAAPVASNLVADGSTPCAKCRKIRGA
jgi:hypothetical protein